MNEEIDAQIYIFYKIIFIWGAWLDYSSFEAKVELYYMSKQLPNCWFKNIKSGRVGGRKVSKKEKKKEYKIKWCGISSGSQHATIYTNTTTP